jgi:hypothetical protein
MSSPAGRCLLDTSAVIARPSRGELPPDLEFLICTTTVAQLNVDLHGAHDPTELAVRANRLP